jgi:hypothetical protein
MWVKLQANLAMCRTAEEPPEFTEDKKPTLSNVERILEGRKSKKATSKIDWLQELKGKCMTNHEGKKFGEFQSKRQNTGE